jgi:sodium-dependent dicarboxylate transporter 2/3/5
MAPIGWLMTFLLWGFFMVVMKPKKRTIPGLREKAKRLSEGDGRHHQKRNHRRGYRDRRHPGIGCFGRMKSTIPGFVPPHKTAVLLTSTDSLFRHRPAGHQ